MAKSCKWCGSTEHTQFYCPRKPRTPIKTNKLPAKIGRVGKKTNAAVAKWSRGQKPNHQGYYICYMCGAWITYLRAEHVKSKVRRPDLRAEPSNFKPTCDPCNEKKRSKDLEEMGRNG